MFELDTHPDHFLDAALDSYPLAPVPPGLVRRTLARLQLRPQFRLEFLDLAVPLFLIVFILLTVWVTFWTLNTLSPHWMLALAPRLAFARQWLEFELMRLPSWLPLLVMILGSTTLIGVVLSMILMIERSLISMRLRN